LLFIVSIFSAFILLDKRENSFCVPMERSASILAGVIAAFVLAAAFGQKPPSHADSFGALLLVVAILVLVLGPRFDRMRAAAPASS
jgi:membrane protein YdbS with pleckstrin-like domain